MRSKRYLLLCRMHLVRQALRTSAPDTTTVTNIAAQYGFWQFGRFAANTGRSSAKRHPRRSTGIGVATRLRVHIFVNLPKVDRPPI